MARQSELTGIVRPKVDSRSLERDVERPMGRALDRVSNITPSLNLRGVGRQLERAVPGSGLLRRGRSAVGGGGSGGGGGRTDLVSLAQERNAILRRLAGTSEKRGVTEALGGGEGDGDGGGAGSAGLGFGLGRLLGGGLGTAARFGGPLAGIAIAGNAAREGARRFLPGGEDVIRNRERFTGFSGIRNAIQDPAGFMENSFRQMVDPTGAGEALAVAGIEQLQNFEWPDLPDLPDLGSQDWPDLPDLSMMDWPELPDLGRDLEWPSLPPEIQNLDQQLDWPDAPQWVQDLQNTADQFDELLGGTGNAGNLLGEIAIDLAGLPGGGAPGVPDAMIQDLAEALEPHLEDLLRRQFGI